MGIAKIGLECVQQRQYRQFSGRLNFAENTPFLREIAFISQKDIRT